MKLLVAPFARLSQGVSEILTGRLSQIRIRRKETGGRDAGSDAKAVLFVSTHADSRLKLRQFGLDTA
jgi:hypothetical protein